MADDVRRDSRDSRAGEERTVEIEPGSFLEGLVKDSGLDPATATDAEIERVVQQEANDQSGLNDMVRAAGLDPATATQEEIEEVVIREEYDQNGLTDLIRSRGGDPDNMSLDELERAADEAASEREADLEKLPGANGELDPPPAPDDTSFDGPAPDQPGDPDNRQGNNNDNTRDFFDGPTPGPAPDSNGDQGGKDDKDDKQQGGPDSGEPDPQPQPRGGDPIDEGPVPKNNDQGDDNDQDDNDDSPPEDEFDPDDYSDFGEASVEGTFDTTDGGTVEGTAIRGEDGTWTVVGDDGTTYAVSEEGAEELDKVVEEATGGTDEPIEQFVAPNLHADDPVVAEMIMQEHDAKAVADIDYGDQDSPTEGMAYADIRPDQIDYGTGGAPPSGDPDVPLEAPDAGVIDPSELDDPTIPGGGRADEDPSQRLAAEQAASGDTSGDRPADEADDDNDGVESRTDTEFAAGDDQPAATSDDFGAGSPPGGEAEASGPLVETLRGPVGDDSDPYPEPELDPVPVAEVEPPELVLDPDAADLVATDLAGQDIDQDVDDGLDARDDLELTD